MNAILVSSLRVKRSLDETSSQTEKEGDLFWVAKPDHFIATENQFDVTGVSAENLVIVWVFKVVNVGYNNMSVFERHDNDVFVE